MDVSNYQLEDFIKDERFIQWVKSPCEESNAMWGAYSSKYPQKRAVMQEAREIISFLDFKEDKPEEGKLLSIWENIAASEPRASFVIPDYKTKSSFQLHKYKWAVAASFLLAMISFYYVNRYTPTTIATVYGESRTIFLPDSTKVTLNSNSSLTFTNNSFNTDDREVWLTGEAFFSVVHKSKNENFIVHTDELQVEVLGTKFNVNSRRGNTKVVLEEGKVKLNVDGASEKSSLIMKPNDMISFSGGDQKIIQSEVNAQDYLAWKTNRLIYVGASLKEIAEQLEDTYGYSIVFDNNEIKDRKFTGSTSSDDLTELFNKLETLFDLKILVTGKQMTIKENPGQHSRP